MTRLRISTTERVRIFEAAAGVCHICLGKIHVGDVWEVSHPIPLALGGADDATNRRPAHFKCHRSVTAEEDIPAIARAKRRFASFIGATRPKSRPMPGSKASGIRRRMSGAVERWPA